jgi:hypothetical protein
MVVDVASKCGGGMGAAGVSCADTFPSAFGESLTNMLEYKNVICNYFGVGNGRPSFGFDEWTESAEAR